MPPKLCILVLLLFPVCFWITHLNETRLPPPVPSDGVGLGLFSEERARVHLNALSSDIGPRLTGSHACEVEAVEYMVSVLGVIKAGASPGIRMDVEVQREDVGAYAYRNTTRGPYFKEPMRSYDNGHWMMWRNISNVVARIGPAGKRNAKTLLLVAHFDTGKTSPGACDDTVHIASLLELLRAFSKSPELVSTWNRDIVVLMNGAEEVGLMGAHCFMSSHRWAASADQFINLEAIGAGGRLMYFRGGLGRGDTAPMIRAYAAVGDALGSSIGEELYQSGLIKANTDAQIVNGMYGVPGIDIVTYANAYVYHSPLDVPEAIETGSVQALGDVVSRLAHAVAAGNSTETGKLGIVSVPGMGGFAVARDTVVAVVSVVAWAVIAGILAFSKTRGDVAVAVASTGLAILAAVVSAVGVGALIAVVQPLSWFGRGPAFTFALFSVPAVLGFISVQAAFPRRDESTETLGSSLVLAAVALLLQRVAPFSAVVLTSPLVCLALLSLARGEWVRGAVACVGLPLPLIMVIDTVSIFMKVMVPMFSRMPSTFPSDIAMSAIVGVLTLFCGSAAWPLVAGVARRPRVRQAVAVLAVVLIGTALLQHPFTDDRQQRLVVQLTAVAGTSPLPACDSDSTPDYTKHFMLAKSLGGRLDPAALNMPDPGQWRWNDTYAGMVEPAPPAVPITALPRLCRASGGEDGTVVIRGVHPGTPHCHVEITGNPGLAWSLNGTMTDTGGAERHSLEVVAVGGVWEATLRVNGTATIEFGAVYYWDIPTLLEPPSWASLMLSPRVVLVSSYKI